MTMKVVVLLLLCSLPYCFARKRKNGNPDARDILVINFSGAMVDLFWIHPQTKERVSATGKTEGIAYGADTPINSYVSHSFEIQELPDSTTGKCKQMCRKAYFKVSRNEDQVYTIREDFSIDIEDNKSRAMVKAKTALQECREQRPDKSLAPEQQLEQLTECLKRRVNITIQEQNEEISFQKQVRKSIGQRLTHYACHDPSLNTSDSVRTTTWEYHNNDRVVESSVDYEVSVLVESDSDAAFVIHKAVTPEECQLLVKASSSKDGSIPLRKRKQLKSIVDKIEQMLSVYLEADVELDEEPMLQVKRATPATAAAEISDECVMKDDGTCQDSSALSKNDTKLKIIEPTMAAHLEIVCEAPEAGGGWLFHRAGAFMNPKTSVGDAVLMRFYDPVTRKRAKDPLLDEYVECPVLEGKLVTITVDV